MSQLYTVFLLVGFSSISWIAGFLNGCYFIQVRTVRQARARLGEGR